MNFIEEIFGLLRPRERTVFERDSYAEFVINVIRKFVVIFFALAFAAASIYAATNFFEVVIMVSEFIDTLGKSLGL
nr:hypothetical protein [Bacteroidota bacterium]